jgi:hypothetical protein
MSMNPQTNNLAQPVRPIRVSDFAGLKEAERP